MNAAFLQTLGHLEVCETERPPCPPRGVVLRVRACAICGSDLRTFKHGHHAVTLPHILGHEIAGEVVEVDAQEGFEVGDRVAMSPAVSCGRCLRCRSGHLNQCDNLLAVGEDTPGGYAEYVALPAGLIEAGYLIHIPGGLSFEAAALAEPLSCVLNGQELVRVSLDDTVAVIGLGAIGCMHIAASRLRGARKILAFDISPARLEMARFFNADIYADAKAEDPVEVVRRATGGDGVDVAIVACGSSEAQKQAVDMAAKGGRISFFGGLPRGNSLVSVNTNTIHYRELTVVGAFGTTPIQLQRAANLIASGLIPADRLVTHVFPLEEIGHAFEIAASEESLRVVVTP